MDIWVLYSMYIFLFSHVHLQGRRNGHEGYFDSVTYWMSSNETIGERSEALEKGTGQENYQAFRPTLCFMVIIIVAETD